METNPYPDPAISPDEVADQNQYFFTQRPCKPMEITVSRREIDSYNSQEKPIYTLTVSDGQERVSVNISREEAYRTIDAHVLTAYEEVSFNSFTENRWDNTPPPVGEQPADNDEDDDGKETE